MTPTDQIGIANLIIGGMSSISNAFADASARKAQADYAGSISRINKMFSDLEAGDAIERGEFLAGEIQRRGDEQLSVLSRKAKLVKGAQAASYAGQGVEIDSGSAAEKTLETNYYAALEEAQIRRNTQTDILTIKSNAWRESWGLKTNALSYGTQAEMARITAKNLGRQSLLSGGLNALNYGLRAYGKYKMNAPSGEDTTDDSGSSSEPVFVMPGGN